MDTNDKDEGLRELEAELQARVAAMRTPQQEEALRRLASVSGEEIGWAAAARHADRDAERLRLHRAIARLLLDDPDRVLAIARANLARWLAAYDAPYYQEWDELLRTRSVQEIAGLIVEDSESGRYRRQNSPFVGVLSREEQV